MTKVINAKVILFQNPRFLKQLNLKKMKVIQFLLFASSVFFLVNCATPPDFPIEPQIEFIRLSKDTMLNGTGQNDTIEIIFSFTDGDGDIGFPQGDNVPKNLLLINRETEDTLVDKFTIPNIPENGSSNGIRGEITVQLFQQCCDFEIGSGYLCGAPNSEAPEPFDQLLMDIIIIDQAGHVSNQIQATPLTLICN